MTSIGKQRRQHAKATCEPGQDALASEAVSNLRVEYGVAHRHIRVQFSDGVVGPGRLFFDPNAK